MTDDKSFVEREEILEEWIKSHPHANSTISTLMITLLVLQVFGSKVKRLRRKLPGKSHKGRIIGFACLAKKGPSHQEIPVLCLQPKALLVPGWTLEHFANPVLLRYRKVFQEFYINKQPIMVEVSFSPVKGTGNDDDKSLTDLKLNATLLCCGNVTDAKHVGLWDNKSVPTLKKLKTLINAINCETICFGYDVPDSWAKKISLDIGNDAKVLSLHKTIDDILSDTGQCKLASNECKILKSKSNPACEKCCSIMSAMFHNKESTSSDTLSSQGVKDNVTDLRKELVKLRRKNKLWQQQLVEMDGEVECDGSSAQKDNQIYCTGNEGSNMNDSDENGSNYDDSDDTTGSDDNDSRW